VDVDVDEPSGASLVDVEEPGASLVDVEEPGASLVDVDEPGAPVVDVAIVDVARLDEVELVSTSEVPAASSCGDAGESVTSPATLPTAASATPVATSAATTQSPMNQIRRVMSIASHPPGDAALTDR
jgi:hypothetical protein